MARPLRIEYDGAVYHITSRGNERKAIYKNDEDRLLFLDVLAATNRKFNWFCHAYCLMNNHYHLVIETPDGNLSKGMRQLNGVYTQGYNRSHGRVGHVFQGRYKAIVIEKESQLLEVCRYVVLNPVRAKAVMQPEEWKWSSYRATAGKEKPHLCLTTQWVLGQFGTHQKSAEKDYKRFIEAGIGQGAIWENVTAQSILGGDEFTGNLMEYAKGQRDIKEIPKMQRHIKRPGLGELFQDRVRKNKTARDEKIREAVEKHAYSQREIADHLGMNPRSVIVSALDT